MRIGDIRKEYHEATGKASALLRNINYSLIAIVWILCNEKTSNLPHYKYLLLLLVLSLAIDFLQYFAKSFIGQCIYQKREKEEGKLAMKERRDPDFDNKEVDGYSKWLRWFTTFCFYFKCILTFVAIVYIIIILF